MRVRAHPSVKLVGFVAAEFGNYEDGAEVRPGASILAAVAGEMNERTAKVALAQLRDWGLLWRYVEGRKYGRRGVADCYRLTIPVDILTRVPMLTPDYKVPEQVTSDHPFDAEQVTSDQVIEADQVTSDHQITPDHVTSDHQFPVDNSAEQVTSDQVISEQVICTTGTGDLSDRTGDLRSPHLFKDLSMTYSPTSHLLTSPSVEGSGDAQVKTDFDAERQRQLDALAEWERDQSHGTNGSPIARQA
jgi:hypothetical protein